MKYLLILLISITFISCGDNALRSDFASDTLIYKGEEFESGYLVPIAFGKDTVLVDIWYRTFNVDGDNKRVVKFTNGKKTSTFELSNSVNNYTEMTFYSVAAGKSRILWIEDNFGRTVYDIDKHKLLKVKHPDKELSQVAATGAPYGIAYPLNSKEMKTELVGNKFSELNILESFAVGKIRRD